METIWKYPIHGMPGTDYIAMPSGAKAISVGLQGLQMVLWAEVDTDRPLQIRCVYLVYTGHSTEFADGLEKDFVCTVLMPGGLVIHVYIERELSEWKEAKK